MAAKKKVELFININTEKEFDNFLNKYKDKLICAEIYCDFSGCCTALDRLFAKFKLDIGSGDVELIRVLADPIKALSRLHNQSEPLFMFIVNKKVTQVFRGVNSMKFDDIARQELNLYRLEKQGEATGRITYAIDEATPFEQDWLESRMLEKKLEMDTLIEQQEARQAARKKHRAELIVPYLEDLDFVLYWPHATHAHPELYERWDENNIIMIAREEIQLTKEVALDILYNGDAPINEASILALLEGKALALCLRVLDPVHIVSLVRKILYENYVKQTEDGKTSASRSFGPAYECYKTYSLTREKIWKKRREDRLLQKEEERDNRARRFSEVKRLALQAREEAIELKKVAREQKKMEFLKSGKIDELEKLKNEPFDPEDVDVVIPEADSYVSEEEEFEEDPDEYFPPPGLPVPGFYSPPNDIAKANGLVILFPKVVHERVTPQAEFLPPHVLVTLSLYKRHKIIEQMVPYKSSILHMGIFKGLNVDKAKHVAYSVKQFDSMDITTSLDEFRLCFMMSIKRDIPLLNLMDFNPTHVSRDSIEGEVECAALFDVKYGDDYPEFEDFDESVTEKRIENF